MKKLNNKIKRKVRNRKKLKDVSLNKLRISVTKSLNNLSAQIIDDLNKKTVVSASSIEKDIKSKKIKLVYIHRKLPRVESLNLALDKSTAKYSFRFDTRSRFKKDYAKTARGRIWPNTEKLIDRYYVIGKYGYEASCDIFPEMSSKVKCTGWPRVDLWRKENDYLFKREKK